MARDGNALTLYTCRPRHSHSWGVVRFSTTAHLSARTPRAHFRNRPAVRSRGTAQRVGRRPPRCIIGGIRTSKSHDEGGLPRAFRPRRLGHGAAYVHEWPDSLLFSVRSFLRRVSRSSCGSLHSSSRCARLRSCVQVPGGFERQQKVLSDLQSHQCAHCALWIHVCLVLQRLRKRPV